MRVRPSFLAALVVLALVVAGAAGIVEIRHRADAQALRTVERAARAVSAPPGAAISHQCHGDGLVGCYVWQVGPRVATTEFATRLGRAAKQQPTVSCEPVRYGVAAGQPTCVVAFRSHGRAAIVSVQPNVVAGAGGPEMTGSLISVSAA